MPRRIIDTKNSDVKPWVRTAIMQEERMPDEILWKNEPSAKDAFDERMRRIKFLRRRQEKKPEAVNWLLCSMNALQGDGVSLAPALNAAAYFNDGL